jgi:sulfite exporter TauE/SafE
VFQGTHLVAKHSIRVVLVLAAGAILALIGFILVAPRGGMPTMAARNPKIGPLHVFTNRGYTESSKRYNVIRIVLGVVMIVVGIALLVTAPA